MPQQTDRDPALSLSFWVSVDGVQIATFTGCEGLTAQYEIEEYREGGNNGFVHRLPGQLSYGNVRLTRAVDHDSGRLAAWFTQQCQQVARKNACVTAFDANRTKVASWTLRDAFPASYSGPSMSVDASGAATETLELAHHGFTQEVGA